MLAGVMGPRTPSNPTPTVGIVDIALPYHLRLGRHLLTSQLGHCEASPISIGTL